tara:strand:+ start:600 stop:800 length:201 start_codon:yes stop_codon:yes gene_type:complete
MAYNTNGGIKVEDKSKLRIASLRGSSAELLTGLQGLIENNDVIFSVDVTRMKVGSGLEMTVVYYLV